MPSTRDPGDNERLAYNNGYSYIWVRNANIYYSRPKVYMQQNMLHHIPLTHVHFVYSTSLSPWPIAPADSQLP